MRHLFALLLLSSLAPAAQAASCQIMTSDLVFGAYRFDSPTDVESTATITIGNCANDGEGLTVAYSISIGPGSGATFSAREMAGPGAPLYYNLYADANRSLIWGDGTAGTVVQAGNFVLPGLTSQTHTAYGRIPAHQTGLTPGTYSDNLLITVTY